VLLTDADIRGESAYNDVLPDIVAALDRKGLLTQSEGAQCVFLAGFVAKDGSPLPLIVQKSDEGYLYSTTDLAAIAFRTGYIEELADGKSPHADRILYVVDARQSLHFRMVFECAYQAGFAQRDTHKLEHVAFGTMMGPDGKPFKTREGGTVKLMDLLDEAEKRAYVLVTAKNAEDVAAERAEPLTDEQRNQIARKVGIGAVKYADLAQNRTSDYVFSWEKMLSLAGNTAPYMQYAYARVRSIFRKGGHEAEEHRADPGAPGLAAPEELALGKMLLRFPETLERALEGYQPNVLAAYLYDLAQAFTAFYEACPVLKSPGAPGVRQARLRLCDLVARTISKGLDLLGIEVADRM
jgi:arginyl-tRNA synthetase